MDECCKQGSEGGFTRCDVSGVPPGLLLDVRERTIKGVDMAPLLGGELALLSYLGSRPHVWHSARRLAESVYRRSDPAGRELVWKYISTLRRKMGSACPELIEACRRRGYCCRELIECALD